MEEKRDRESMKKKGESRNRDEEEKVGRKKGQRNREKKKGESRNGNEEEKE